MSRERRGWGLIVQVSAVVLTLVAPLVAQIPRSFARFQAERGDRPVSRVWTADNGDGTYKNPIIHADYSDPDVIRVGDEFYMTASTFNAAPGLPILHSKDLVNWEIIGHVFKRQPPDEVFSTPQHGGGVWAPAIRYRNGEFYIFYPDPDRGIYMVKANDAAGPWSEPLLIKKARGWEDPCPLWDDDGRAYLVSAMAASRSGIRSVLIVSRMSPDGTRLLDDGVLVFDGHAKHPGVEGPKFYKRGGFYYILAPAGGVADGWQLALRSKSIYGPYEDKIVLAHGKSRTNGPHQGGLVETASGESWFIHFEDTGAYGRIVYLEPVNWVNDWPVIGADPDGDGTGEPVATYRKPRVSKSSPKSSPIMTPQESDEFGGTALGPQWEWFANPGPNWAFPAGGLGFLRLFNVPLPDGFKNFWDVPNILAQRFPAPRFTATTRLTFTPRTDGEKVGLIVTGMDYAYLSVTRTADGLYCSQTICKDAEHGAPERESARLSVKTDTFYLQVRVSENARCMFGFSTDGNNYVPVGEPFATRPGRWIGARLGIFAVRTGVARETGYADFDWFRID